jgi:hypothetical protein
LTTVPLGLGTCQPSCKPQRRPSSPAPAAFRGMGAASACRVSQRRRRSSPGRPPRLPFPRLPSSLDPRSPEPERRRERWRRPLPENRRRQRRIDVLRREVMRVHRRADLI